MKRSLIPLAFAFASIVVSGCHSSVKPLAPINSVDNYCRQGVPKGPGIQSIIASIRDEAPVYTSQSTTDVKKHYIKTHGAIAHWEKLDLYMPAAAKTDGDAEGYLHVTAAALDDVPEGATSRKVLLYMQGAKGDGWYTARAYDLQNTCIEGTRQS